MALDIAYVIDTVSEFNGQVVINYTLSYSDPEITQSYTLATSTSALSEGVEDTDSEQDRLAQIETNFASLIAIQIDTFANFVRKTITAEDTSGLSGYSGTVSALSTTFGFLTGIATTLTVDISS